MTDQLKRYHEFVADIERRRQAVFATAPADGSPSLADRLASIPDLHVAATLAAGIMASGRSEYPATPEGALALFQAMVAVMKND